MKSVRPASDLPKRNSNQPSAMIGMCLPKKDAFSRIPAFQSGRIPSPERIASRGALLAAQRNSQDISGITTSRICFFRTSCRQASHRPGTGRNSSSFHVVEKSCRFNEIRVVEGHSASRLCAAVCSFGSDGQGCKKVGQSQHGRDGHAPFFCGAKGIVNSPTLI